MRGNEAISIINAGLVWANWTDEQKEAMRIAIHAIDSTMQDGNTYALSKEQRAIRQFEVEKNHAETKDSYDRHQACGFMNGMRYMNELFNLKIDFPEEN